MTWTCPDCGRSFGRRAQPHSCVRSPSVQDWLSDRAPEAVEVVEAVRRHVETLGEAYLEATRDAVMVKRARTFAEVKIRPHRTELSFIVSRRVDDPRVVRTLDLTRTRIVHVVELSGPADVDQQILDWLTEAYEASPR